MTKKEEYIDKLAAQLKEWSVKIDELETKADAAKVEAKAGLEKQIKQLKEQQDAAMKKLQELKGSSNEAWDTLKAGAEKAWADLKNAVSAAKDKFNKS